MATLVRKMELLLLVPLRSLCVTLISGGPTTKAWVLHPPSQSSLFLVRRRGGIAGVEDSIRFVSLVWLRSVEKCAYKCFFCVFLWKDFHTFIVGKSWDNNYSDLSVRTFTLFWLAAQTLKISVKVFNYM